MAEYLCRNGIHCTVCVATEYGEQVMDKQEGLTVRQGRMTAEEMKDFIDEGGFLGVVDATHPFATVVSENIIQSMKDSHLPYFRLKRNTNNRLEQEGDVTFLAAMKPALPLWKIRREIFFLRLEVKNWEYTANQKIYVPGFMQEYCRDWKA